MAKITKARLKASADSWERYDSAKSKLVTAARLEAAFDKAAKLNPKHREKYIDARIAQENTRDIEFCVGGSLITLAKEPGYEMYEGAERSKRGRVSNFSAKSRQRMMKFVCGLLTTALPLFVHLTYPASWSPEWQAWKAHLATLWKRIRRKWPKASALWKLEPQERGAPHYHLLLWGVGFMHHEWLANAWFEVVGSGDPDHLRAGTRVEAAKSVAGVQAYCSKNYMGKTVTLPDGWDYVGRWWGVLGRENVPQAPRAKFRIGKAQAFRFRRLVRRYFRSKGLHTRAVRGKYLGRVELFTQQIMDWVRALDHCGGLDIVPRLLGVPLECTPF